MRGKDGGGTHGERFLVMSEQLKGNTCQRKMKTDTGIPYHTDDSVLTCYGEPTCYGDVYTFTKDGQQYLEAFPHSAWGCSSMSSRLAQNAYSNGWFGMPITGMVSGTFIHYKEGTSAMNKECGRGAACSAFNQLNALLPLGVADGGLGCAAPPRLGPHVSACSMNGCNGE